MSPDESGQGAPPTPTAHDVAEHRPVLRRVLRVAALARRQPSARTQRILLAVSLVAFVTAAIFGLGNLPDLGTGLVLPVLALGLLLMPVTILLNAAEFMVLGYVVGGRVHVAQAVRVTLIGSAANILPIPGSTLVRIQALAAAKARYRDAVTASVVLGLLSVSASLLLAGVVNSLADPTVTSATVAAIGIATVFGSLMMMRVVSVKGARGRLGLAALALELVYAGFSSLRLWLIMVGLGLDVSLPAAFALTATGFVATAVGFFPAGLGIREALLGAVSPLVGIPVAVGVAAAVVERIFWFVVLALSAGVILVRDGRQAFAVPRDHATASETA